MRVEEFFEKIAPDVAQIDIDKESALFALGGSSTNECGAIRGETKSIVQMIVSQMLAQKDIAKVIMCAAEVFVECMEEEANKDAKGQQQKLS